MSFMSLPISKTGLWFVAPPLLITLILFSAGQFQFAEISLIISLFTVFFFRDPNRIAHPENETLVAAADGKIAAIQEINEELFIKEPSVRIITHLSVFNVHINRSPIGGIVKFQRHEKGKHYIAFSKKAHNNEKNFIGIENGNLKILVTQITGSIARRIVSYVEIDDELIKGDRIGLIKFGSRTDVIIPKSKLEKILVKIGDKTKGAETPIAIIKK